MADDELDRLIDAWAERRAPELIARAEAEAIAAATRRLKDRMEAALVRAARSSLGGPPGETGDPLIWVYGIVDAAPGEATGVDGHPVLVHRHAGVGALISRVPHQAFNEEALSARLEDLDDVAGLARAHDGVLEAAMSTGPVLPFRLCTIYSSVERFDVMLDRETSTLTSTLRRLAGTQEWGVKAFAPARTEPEEVSTGAASGAAYLTLKREQRDAADAARQASEAAVASIHARLAERAAAATLSSPHDRRLSGRDAEMLLNAAYLVPIDGTDTFRALVDQMAQDQGLELELTGPWPPYHFTDPPEA